MSPSSANCGAGNGRGMPLRLQPAMGLPQEACVSDLPDYRPRVSLCPTSSGRNRIERCAVNRQTRAGVRGVISGQSFVSAGGGGDADPICLHNFIPIGIAAPILRADRGGCPCVPGIRPNLILPAVATEPGARVVMSARARFPSRRSAFAARHDLSQARSDIRWQAKPSASHSMSFRRSRSVDGSNAIGRNVGNAGISVGEIRNV